MESLEDLISPELKINDKLNDVEDVETMEKQHFQRIVSTFRSYRVLCLRRLHRSVKYVNSLSECHQELLKGYRSHLDKVHVGIEHNYEIVKLILKDISHMFENKDHSSDIKIRGIHVSPYDMEKMQGIFKQLYREWSAEGKAERDASFKVILDEILMRFPANETNLQDIHVLVPGAGLGRLPYEIAKRGFSCQGNEFSLFMLFTSNFVLNKTQGVNLYRIYPWIHQHCNNLTSDDQTKSVLFPDADPSALPPNSKFSMAAGNFTEIYKTSETWHCIATCFFLDTAHNVINYIETIWNILKPGGFWINLGPLLYHHADLPNEDSIEPSYEEIRYIIAKIGFIFLKEERNIKTLYSQNPNSMLTYEYKSVFFVCEKPKY